MRELGPDRLSDDGRYLVLREPGRPELFRVPVDRRLAALVEASPRARGRAHGQMEITMESSLTPREIQTRIRRGESPDQVAESAGVPTEQIEGFATPVLAERAYMAEQARTTTIRRRHAAGPGVLLGTAVDESVAAQGGVPEEAAWDAWRREDGRWTVQVFAPDALEPARFCFDAKSRYVLPDDEAARLLVGDVAAPEATDMAIADALRADEERVEEPTTPEAEPEEQLLVHLPDEAPHALVHSLKEARDRRAMEQLSLTDEPTPDPARPAQRRDETPRRDEPATEASEPEVAQAEDDVEEHVAVPDTVAPRGKKRPERRRVPSWDEIMFGGRPE
ncbi:septation protein SepH [Aeromicrobium sp.]|uniref:septation protein SepH n=1 Tax=Aeromicrobium sp. TaxID=1871063 RepID=UPI0035152FB3